MPGPTPFDRRLIALFNFSREFVTAYTPEDGPFEELSRGERCDGIRQMKLWPYGFAWLTRQ